MSQISLCNKCYLWNILGEKHDCIMTGVNYIQHEMRNGRAYIVKISLDGQIWKDIQPIPSFMQIEAEKEIFD